MKNFNGANAMDVADDEVRAFLNKYDIHKVNKFLLDLTKNDLILKQWSTHTNNLLSREDLALVFFALEHN